MVNISRVTGPGSEAGIHWGKQELYALNLVINGEGELRSSATEIPFSLTPGTIYQHFPPDQGGKVSWVSAEVSEIFILLDLRTWSRMHAFGLFPDERVMQLPAVDTGLDFITTSCERMKNLGNSPFTGEGCRVVAEVMKLLAELFHLVRAGKRIDHPQLEAVGRVCQWMENHPADRRPLPELAKQVGLSYASLRKYFPGVTGMSLSHYRILCRIHRAQRLLADFNVQETAEQLGFADPFVFSNQFKARTGVAPREYRKQMKGSG